jgi:hypothetical protein
VFVQLTEKKQFPGSRFFRRGGIWPLAEAKKAPGEKTALRRIKNWRVVIRYAQSRSQKWKSWL